MKRVYQDYHFAKILLKRYQSSGFDDRGFCWVDDAVRSYTLTKGTDKVSEAFSRIRQAEDDGYITLGDQLESLKKEVRLTGKGRKLISKEFGIPLFAISEALKSLDVIFGLLSSLVSLGLLAALVWVAHFIIKHL